MNEIKTGDRIRRVVGDRCTRGAVGTVVETNETTGRIRVKWEGLRQIGTVVLIGWDNPCKTWIKASCVEPYNG